MKTWAKAIAILLGSMVLLVVAAVVAALLLFDGERIKAVLEEAVAEKTGRTLRIATVPELSLWPRLGVRLGAVTLSEKLGDAEFAGIDGAELSVAVMPLFSGRLVADALTVSGLRARLLRYPDGRMNFEDLLGGAAGASPSEGAGGAERGGTAGQEGAGRPPIDFDVEGISLAGPEIRWEDRQAGQTLRIADFSVRTGRLGPGASGELALAAKLQRETDQASADALAFSLRSAYRFGVQAIEFSRLDIGLGGTVAGIESMKLAVEGERVSLAHAGGGPAAATISAGGLTLRFSGRVEDLSLESTIGADALTLTPRVANQAAPVSSSGGASGARDFSVSKLALKVGASRPDGWRASAEVAGSLTATLPEARLTFTEWKGQGAFFDPGLLQKAIEPALAFSAEAELAGPRFSADLQAKLDSAEHRIKAVLSTLTPLTASLDVRLGALDLDAYLLPPPEAEPAQGSGAAAPAGKADDPVIDLAVLRGPKLTATVTADRIKVRGVTIGKLSVAARLAGGRLDLAPVKAALYEGQLDATLRAEADGNALAIKSKLAEVDLLPLLRDVAGTDLLAGRADVDAALTTRGATVGAMKRALGGDIGLRVRDGALQGVNLGKSFRDLKSRFSSRDDAEVSASQDARTDFSELTATFKAKDGVLSGDDLAAKSPFLRLSGAGRIDLPAETLDYLLKASVVATSAGQGGDDLSHLRGVTVPVRLRGPLTAPKWKIEFGSLASEAAKARLEEKASTAKERAQEAVETRKDELRERAKDKLKNLLGR